MKTTKEEKLRRVKALYDRATNPGEKAAAFEALKRLQGIANKPTHSIPPNVTGNWLQDMKVFLTSRGFWNCCTTGNEYLFTKERSTSQVKIIDLKTSGVWHYYYNNGRRVSVTGKPVKSGNTRDQLLKVL